MKIKDIIAELKDCISKGCFVDNYVVKQLVDAFEHDHMKPVNATLQKPVGTTLQKIECQDSNCGKRVSPFDANWEVRGCNTCGGYGYVLQQLQVECCQRRTWVRPDSITVYNGKKLQAVNGLVLIFRDNGGPVCGDCYQVFSNGKKKIVRKRRRKNEL